MSAIDDGGQAFPHPDYLHAGPVGMSLRDYFASKAMQGLLACPDLHQAWTKFASDSYVMADAMLKARQS